MQKPMNEINRISSLPIAHNNVEYNNMLVTSTNLH